MAFFSSKINYSLTAFVNSIAVFFRLKKVSAMEKNMLEIINQLTEIVKILLDAPTDKFWGIVALIALALLVYGYTKGNRE